jgi:hypothetical protein
VVLGHESYRDGIVTSDNIVETQRAVKGHTEMALRMLTDGQRLSENNALGRDVYEYLVNKNGSFNSYVDGTYDSSEDYWKLVQKPDGTYGFAWDGNLNIYDEEGNEIVNYKEIVNVLVGNIQNINRSVKLGDDGQYTVRFMEMIDLQRFNNRIVQYGKNNPSEASRALLDDGKMEFGEANPIAKDISNSSIFYIPDMIEHLSVRYVMNQTDKMITAVGDDTSKWTIGVINRIITNLGIIKPSNDIQLGSGTITMELLTSLASLYHGPGNFKWQSEQGNELVINRLWQTELDPRYIGTYNFGSGTAHIFQDMLPYYLWGNSPDDLNNLGNRYTKNHGKIY